MLTYLGNKRSLLGFIGQGVAEVRRRLGGRRLRVADLFAGSGVVSRFLKQHASLLISNDLEAYAEVMGRCYLANPATLDTGAIAAAVEQVNAEALARPRDGFIRELYAPRDEARIGLQDRVFYTVRNARFLDAARQEIARLPAALQPFVLAPLLSEASVHANTAGVFKGFYKDRHTGIGRFGGTGSDALSRIRAGIVIPEPYFSRFDCEVELWRRDAVELAGDLPELDLVYLDPPYNQHPYGSNYFMLNLLVDYRRPSEVSRVSGIPRDWQRSVFNRRAEAQVALRRVVEEVPARFVLLSFNSEGFVGPEDLQRMLAELGEVQVMDNPHPTFRGSRNLRQRELQVTEFLYLLQKAT